MKRILFRFVLIGLLLAAATGRGFSATFDWVGNSSTGGVYNWNNKLNWQVNGVATTAIPGAADIVHIGVNPFTNNPTVTDAESCGSIIFGASNNLIVTVNGTLTVSGNIIQNNSPNLSRHTILAGTGSITCGSLQLSGSLTAGPGTLIVSGAFQINGGTFVCGSGDIIFKGDYTNNGTFTAGNGTVYFSGASQRLIDNSITGTTFNKVTFNGTGTATMVAGVGNFSVSDKGILTLVAPAKLVAGSSNVAYLTLKSDVAGSASIAALSGESSISGLVNVQHYIHGGNVASRGYRLLSSPVCAGIAGTNNIISINYLKNSVYLTGTSGTSGGFDKTGNPTVYLFRENLPAGNNSSSSTNFRGLNSITARSAYGLDNEMGTYNIPAGNGFMFFFRGNRSTSLASKTVAPYIAPENTTITATGTLIAGQVTVRNWYNPTSASLGYSLTSDTTTRGFNLVGNPYASSINWDLVQNKNTSTAIYAESVSNTIYVMDPVSKNYSAYTKGTGGVGTHNAGNIIASGQGFFVRATAQNAKLIFNESAKVNSQPVYHLAVKPAEYANNQYLQLQLAKDSVNTDDIIVHFNSAATANYNPEIDGKYKPGSGLVSLYSLSCDKVSLAINSLPLPKTTESICLSATATTDGVYQLKLKNIVAVPRLFDVWLVDNYKNDSVNMRETPVYAFSITKSDANSFGAKRFKLVISQNASMAYHLSNFGAFSSDADQEVFVKWQTVNEGNYTSFTIERSNDNGNNFKVVGQIPGSGQENYSLVDKSPKTGVNLYRLKQVDINGTVSYSKVISVKYAGTSNSLTANNINVRSQTHKE